MSQQVSFVVEQRKPRLPESERPLNRLREVGTYGVSTAELLALVLRKRDLEDAHVILGQFQTLDWLANATEEELTALPGIGAQTAAALHAALELGRRLVAGQAPERPQIRSPHDAAQILLPLIGTAPRENFAILYLNTRNHVTDKEILYQGSLNTSLVRIAEVFQGAIRRNCAGIIVGHNHPSGDPNPSPEDIALTRRLVQAGKVVEVDVLDHLVVAHGTYISLRERQLGFEEV